MSDTGKPEVRGGFGAVVRREIDGYADQLRRELNEVLRADIEYRESEQGQIAALRRRVLSLYDALEAANVATYSTVTIEDVSIEMARRAFPGAEHSVFVSESHGKPWVLETVKLKRWIRFDLHRAPAESELAKLAQEPEEMEVSRSIRIVDGGTE